MNKREREREIKNLSDKKNESWYIKQNKTNELNFFFYVQKCLNSADELGSVKNEGGGGGGALPVAAAVIIANCKSRSRACCSSIKR